MERQMPKLQSLILIMGFKLKVLQCALNEPLMRDKPLAMQV